MPNVFISYVRDDKPMVDRLVKSLSSSGVEVWIDRKNIRPGMRWADAIRQGIAEGDCFLACFSGAYLERSKTYMNEELVLAIEELRKRPIDTEWFIPVRLSECEIPQRSIGAGETLHSLQRVDLFEEWDEGIERIVSVVRPQPGTIRIDRRTLESLVHSIASPLVAISATADYLRSRKVSLQQLDEELEAIGSHAFRIQHQLRSIRALTLLLQRQPRIFRIKLDVRRELEATLGMLRLDARQRGLDLSLGGTQKLPKRASLDRQLFKTLLVSVLENAIAYSHSGSNDEANGVIGIGCGRSSGDRLVLDISSVGLPIADEDRERIFELGFRGQTARAVAVEGTGRGLFLAERIVEAHGGEISVSSNRSSDETVFVIELPMDVNM